MSGPFVRVELRRDAGRVGPRDGPWIRRRSIARILGTPDPRHPVLLQTFKGEPVGWGLVSPDSAITVRMITFDPAPPPDDWLERRLRSAVRSRDRLGFDAEDTTGIRVVNSEGDGLPGLTIDRYGSDVVVQLTTAPMVCRREAIERFVEQHLGGRIHVSASDWASIREGFDAGTWVTGPVETLHFRERGLDFWAPAPPAQKTGAYFDQRDNHASVAELARRRGGSLLDVGCHVGGFSLHAARRGVHCVAVDRSETSLRLARRGAADNGLTGIDWIQADMFRRWEDPALAGPFGTIVLDPPKLVARRTDVDRATAALTRMFAQALARLEPSGYLVLCSCSRHLGTDRLDALVCGFEGPWRRLHRLGPAPDHPVAAGHVDGDYLQVLVLQRIEP